MPHLLMRGIHLLWSSQRTRDTHTYCRTFGSGLVRYDYIKRQKRRGPEHIANIFQNPYEFDLEVKDKGHTGDMNVRNTSFHCDTPMCQTWYANVKAKRSYSLNTNLQTDRPTD